jgi:hypothetical protein
MFEFEQIATQTYDIDYSIQKMGEMGHHNWVRDTVHAQHIFVAKGLKEDLGDEFTVKLAFNYEVFPTHEFELIQLTSGRTVQLPVRQIAFTGGCNISNPLTSISHFGYHVDDQNDFGEDTLLREIKRVCALGAELCQISQTVDHANTPKRYRYAFVMFPAVGAPVKIIQRLSRDAEVSSLKQGIELFAGM